jgi:DNA-nicking Smr family endonuclease
LLSSILKDVAPATNHARNMEDCEARAMSKESHKDSKSSEHALFREAMRGVAPLAPARRKVEKPAPKPIANSLRRDEARALKESLEHPPDDADVETGEEMSFRRPGLPVREFRKLRRGQFAVRAELDLHGLTADEALDALREFIADARAEGARCVRVVHGKGLGSGPRGPVLRNLVNKWLRRWDPVLAFCTTQPRHGGTGAVYVLLRR